MSVWNDPTRIPIDYINILVQIFSFIINIFAIYIIFNILKRTIPLPKNIKHVMLICNTFGILWYCIAISRYYYYPYNDLELFHYSIGMVVVISDFMAQFELLKVFEVISGLSRGKIRFSQLFMLLFCTITSLGPIFIRIIPDNVMIRYWDQFGSLVIVLVIVLFSIWFYIFLTTKLYQSMNVCVDEEQQV
jgi:hypothetical protein